MISIFFKQPQNGHMREIEVLFQNHLVFLLYPFHICLQFYNFLLQRIKKKPINANRLEGGLQSFVSLHHMKNDQVRKLGQGGFSCVYLETHNNITYACKKIKLALVDFRIRYLVDEINSLRCLNHPNLIRCHGFAFNSFMSFDIYMEYIEGRTLDVAYGPEPQEEVLFYWVYQIAKAFVYLEQVGIVHRDIKPRNILVNNRGLIKVIDFGISKLLYNHYSRIVGSPSYIAPEIIMENSLCHKSDIWSLGISLYELTHKAVPFEQESERTLFAKICTEKIKVSREFCSEEMANLIEKMLQVDPNDRISAQQILNLQCFKSREEHFERYYLQAIQNS